MILDGRRIPQDDELETDMCIVGAGATGITLARSLDLSGLNVCLLESGGMDYDSQTNSLYEGRNLGLPYWPLAECQLRMIGGNTNGWGGWCRPLEALDFERRDWVPCSGWPFGAKELAPYYPRAQEICQLRRDNFDVAAAVSHLADPSAGVIPADPARFETHLYQFSPPTRFGRVYLDEIRRSERIMCLLHATGMGIQVTNDASQVASMRAGSLTGARFRVRAKIYVLASGGIENARQLLLSRDVAPLGLGNDHDLVGRYFTEHPHTKRRMFLNAKRPALALYGLKYYGRGLAARLSLTPAQQEHEALLGYSANLHAEYRGEAGAGFASLRKLVLTLSQSRSLDPFVRAPPYGPKGITARDIGNIIANLPGTTFSGFLQAFRTEAFVKHYVLESKSEQAPNRDSRVTLDHARDRLGLNRSCLDWCTLPIDRRTIVRAEELLGEELQRLNIGRLEPLTPDEVESWPRTGVEGGWHQLGTTRMADNPREGVVDRNCRVHGVANLFVAGGSVFPTVGTAPPTLTAVAMTLRLADHLKQRFVAAVCK
ncbi:MAG: GMC family oxidoreductase [Methylocella sp.]